MEEATASRCIMYLHDFIWEIGHGSFDRSNNSFCSCNFKEFSERVAMTLPL